MTDEVELPHPNKARFDAAIGWLMLGLPDEALRELEQMTPPGRLHPEVLELEWALQAQANRWTEARVAAEALTRVAPERPFGWIHLAYCLRRIPGGSLDSAWNVLRPAYDRFPQERIIPYNLACYAAQMGRLDDAWKWLRKAVEVAGNALEIKALALADPDLDPLRDRINGL